MFPIVLLRAILAPLSIAVLAIGGYLLWSWYDGETVRGADGALYLVRENWRLWTAIGLLAWSFLGRLVVTPLLAKSDKGEPSRPERGQGRRVASPSGADLYVEEHGPASAPTIIFTHGWGLDSTIWRLARLTLAKDYRLILWDLPGLGLSKAPKDGAISLEGFATDLETLIEGAGRERVFLVGHSIGGMTIQTLARDRPQFFNERVAGVALFNTTFTNPLQTMIFAPLLKALRRPLIEPMMRLMIWLQPLAWLSAWQGYLSGSAHMANRLGFGRDVTRSQLEHTTLLATRNPPAVQARGNLAMFRWDASDALTAITTPFVVVGGAVDIVTRLAASDVIVSEARHARLQVVEGANHMGFLERADLYHAAIAALTASSATVGSPRAA